MNNVQSALQFFLQITVLLVSCRIVGWGARRLGQPQVVAEMLTGILLGPSLFGWVAPDWQQWLFPWDPREVTRDSQSYLYPAAQLGLALYMFVVGLEFRADIVGRHWKPALAVSVAGMVFPFLCGALLGWWLHADERLIPPGTLRSDAALFLGVSLCITAFPMLARIVEEKRLTGTLVGAVSVGAGALNDVAAWCLLALLLARLDTDSTSLGWSVGGGLGLVVVAWGVLRPLAQRWQDILVRDSRLTDAGFAIGLVCAIGAAWFTDLIGLHAVFGAFVVGAVMPRGVICRDLMAGVSPLTVALLLPLFFVYSGLNTQLGLLMSPALWGYCALVLVVAVLGKGGGCWLAARQTGIPPDQALGIGALMNTRGLMELIIINIGLQRGLITVELFTMLVLMAVATTMMTSPLFDFVTRRGGGAPFPAEADLSSE